MYTAGMAPYTFSQSYLTPHKDDVKVVRYIAEKYGVVIIPGLLVVIQGTFEYLTPSYHAKFSEGVDRLSGLSDIVKNQPKL